MITTKFLSFLILIISLQPLFAQPFAADPDPHRFDKEIAAFQHWDKKNSVMDSVVLFVGSSSIRMWETALFFPGFRVVNRGFGGAHFSDVNYYFDKIVAPYDARVIVVYAGDNDVAGEKPAEQVLCDFKKFCAKTDKTHRGVSIIYIPIKPSLARWELWPVMQKANRMIEQHCQSEARLFYADTATPMLGENGEPMPELLLEDGLHMTGKGYRVWTEVVLPVIRRALAQPMSGGQE